MTDTTNKAMTLEQVRDWHLHQLNTLKDSWQPYIHHQACADAIDAHLAAQREEVGEISSDASAGVKWTELGAGLPVGTKLYAWPVNNAQREGEAVAVRFITPDGSVYGQGWENYTNQKLPVGMVSDGWKMELAYSYPPHPRVEVTDETVKRIDDYLFNHWGQRIPKSHLHAALEAALSEKGHE